MNEQIIYFGPNFISIFIFYPIAALWNPSKWNVIQQIKKLSPNTTFTIVTIAKLTLNFKIVLNVIVLHLWRLRHCGINSLMCLFDSLLSIVKLSTQPDVCITYIHSTKPHLTWVSCGVTYCQWKGNHHSIHTWGNINVTTHQWWKSFCNISKV